VLSYFVLFLLLFLLYVWYLQKATVFYPERNLYATPQQMGLAYEDIYFKTEDGLTLHGWFYKSPQAKATLLYFHGNAGNIADRIEKVMLFLELGINVFIIDYRGYGLSDGEPSERGIYKDGVASFDYLITRKDIDPKKIVAYGASLGGVVAIDLATKRSLGGLIVDSSFTSAKEMAKIIYPFIPSLFVYLKMDNASKITNVSAPKLFFHSRTDEVVPFSLGKKLYEMAPSPKEFLEVQGTHNDGHMVSRPIYKEGTKSFLKKYNLL